MRYVAFLRAINVGGHTVRMDRLRVLFEELRLTDVETFIASGNVIFAAPARSDAALERRIENHLRASLGYEVRTFVRSVSEVAQIATHDAFPPGTLAQPFHGLYVAFLAGAPDAAARKRVLALRNPIDDLHVNGRELYWLRRKSLGDSAGVSGAAIEKTLGMAATVRSITTIKKLAAKFCSEPRSQG
jgi:uncharacterized protein (DUF1697 family)